VVEIRHLPSIGNEKTGPDLQYIDMLKIIIFQKITCVKNASPRAELHLKFSDQLIEALIGSEKCFFSKWVLSGIPEKRIWA
jgi:hypothetical protein